MVINAHTIYMVMHSFLIITCAKTALKSHIMSHDSVATRQMTKQNSEIKRELPKLKFDLDSVSYWSGEREAHEPILFVWCTYPSMVRALSGSVKC